MKRVLLTGADGFCGRYLRQAFAEDGFQVTGTYHAHPPASDLHRAVKVDLVSRKDVQKLIRQTRPHYLVHLAAQSSARRSWEFQEETFAVNVGGTLNLLDALRESSPQTRMVLASSIQIYGRGFLSGRPLKENGLVWPENPYAASKRTAELACLDYFRRFGVQVMIARMSNQTGAGQDSHYAFSDWSRQIAAAEKAKRPLRLAVGNLRLERDFLHVEDGVSAYRILLTKGKPGEIYNVASGKPVRLQKYADFLSRQAKVPSKIQERKDRMRTDDAKKMVLSVSKIRALGWKPRLGVYKALSELLQDWRRRV